VTIYPRVDHSHIVPAGYLRAFAVDGRVMMRLVGETKSQLISVRDAGVRKGFYSRTRPDGTRIDDVEHSLAHLEHNTLHLLPKIRDLWPLAPENKQKLAQLFGYQFVRGPRWREWYETMSRSFVQDQVREERMQIRADDTPTTEEDIVELEEFLLGDTRRTIRMFSAGPKVSSLLGSMQWTLLESRSPLVATSDHPVVPWPINERSRRPQATGFELGMFETLEFRVPVSPYLAILMTWQDDEDPLAPVAADRVAVANLNSFTIAQAERQFFHSPELVPPLADGALLPLSPRFVRGYNSDAALRSRRRAAIQEKIQALIGEEDTETIEIITVSRPGGSTVESAERQADSATS